MRYVKRILKIGVRYARNRSNYILGIICEILCAPRAHATFKYPPLFILGAPRSGSTVLFQVLTDAFDVGYLSNRHCRWFGIPALIEKCVNPLGEKVPSDFTSIHGRTKNDYDPAECGAWWYRFFRREPAYVTRDDVSDGKILAFRRSVLALERVFGKPVVFKNLYAGVRLEPLVECLPEAVFVLIERDLVDNAQSILRGRYDTYGVYDRWWSVPPPEVDELSRRSPVGQVVGQIRGINALVERDLERLGVADRVFRIRYEDFCENVHHTLSDFERFMQSQGIALRRRFEVPKQFEVSKSVKIPQAMYDELCRYVESMRSEPARAAYCAATRNQHDETARR